MCDETGLTDDQILNAIHNQLWKKTSNKYALSGTYCIGGRQYSGYLELGLCNPNMRKLPHHHQDFPMWYSPRHCLLVSLGDGMHSGMCTYCTIACVYVCACAIISIIITSLPVGMEVYMFVCPLTYLKNNSAICHQFFLMLHVAVAHSSSYSNATHYVLQIFVNNVMFLQSGANGPESKMMHVSSSSPCGGTGGEVCHLRLHLVFTIIVTSIINIIKTKAQLLVGLSSSLKDLAQ